MERMSGHRTLQAAIVMACLFASLGLAQDAARSVPDPAPAEFVLARMKWASYGGGGSHGYYQPFWAIDYPLAEEHFLRALRRLSRINASADEAQLELTDPRLFDYPFLFMQQPGKGWKPTAAEVAQLREYLLRGGFLLVDDFHGEGDWEVFRAGISRALPGRPVVEIPADDPLLHVVMDIKERLPIPGRRHLYRGPGGQIEAQMEGTPHWRGIYDEAGRLAVVMNFNIDMGDGWEHEDDPVYPVAMTALAHRFGVNYVVYAMTH